MSKTILVVDDVDTEALLVESILKSRNYNLLRARDGNEAYAMAKEHKPDLVLMDVVMPHCNGFQSCRRMHKDAETTNIPVIMVTSKDQDTDRVWAQKQGARAFLTKPVTPEALLGTIDEYL